MQTSYSSYQPVGISRESWATIFFDGILPFIKEHPIAALMCGSGIGIVFYKSYQSYYSEKKPIHREKNTAKSMCTKPAGLFFNMRSEYLQLRTIDDYDSSNFMCDILPLPREIMSQIIYHDGISFPEFMSVLANFSLVSKGMHACVKEKGFISKAMEKLVQASKMHGVDAVLAKAVWMRSKNDILIYNFFKLSYPYGGYSSSNLEAEFKKILAAGIDVNYVFNEEGYNLYFAKKNSHCRSYFIKTDIVLSGGTALIRICSVRERPENSDIIRSIIRMLLNTPNINLAAQDNQGKTALMWSLIDSEDLLAFSELYMKAGDGSNIGINSTDNQGNTALLHLVKDCTDWSCSSRQKGKMEALVYIGADLYLTNNANESALGLLKSKDPTYADELAKGTTACLRKMFPGFLL